MVDVEESKARPKHLHEQVDIVLEFARDEEYVTPCAEDVARVREFLLRVESLGREIADNTWLSASVDGRFSFVTLRPGFRVNYETAEQGRFNLGVVNEATGQMWAREGVDESEVVSELERPSA